MRQIRAALIPVFLFFWLDGLAQNVGINANGAAPDPSAMLDINVSAVAGTKTGLLIPRMTAAERNAIPAPATGLLVYDTTTDEFWYFTGSGWVPLLQALTGWSTTGNAGTVDGTNFLGTTDNVALGFRVNNQEAGRIGTSDENTLFGLGSGDNITSGTANVAMGDNALGATTSGHRNVAIGRDALSTGTNRSNMVAIGDSAMASNYASWNTAVGYRALARSGNGYSNTAIGYNSQLNTTSGYRNTSVGTDCMPLNTTGYQNVAMGYYSLQLNTTGWRNTAVGAYAGRFGTTGSNNTFIGQQAGYQNTTGHNNTFLGYQAGLNADGYDNATAIGFRSVVTASNSLVLGGMGIDAVHVGIGVTAPTAELEVNGYTKLGSNAPAVRMIKLTGTTAAAQGSTVSLAHGLDPTKILSIDINIQYTTTGWVPAHYTFSNGYEVDYYYGTTLLYVRNVAGNSGNVISDPFTVLITYEE